MSRRRIPFTDAELRELGHYACVLCDHDLDQVATCGMQSGPECSRQSRIERAQAILRGEPGRLIDPETGDLLNVR